MSQREFTDKDLDEDEKRVMGKLIDLWSIGEDDDPYIHCTEDRIIKELEKGKISRERIQKILADLESYGLTKRIDAEGKPRFIYQATAEHIVKELQKTTYVESRYPFKPHHR